MSEDVRVNRCQTAETPAAILTYNGQPFTGELEDTDAQGRAIGLTSYVGGIEHGPQAEWYPTGEKYIEGEQGSAVGEWREWYRNGKLAEYSLFDKFGELIQLGRGRQPRRGQAVRGHARTLSSKDTGGNVIGLITYWQGIPHGPRPSGTQAAKSARSVNNAGLAVGEWQKWHPSGQLTGGLADRRVPRHGDPRTRQRFPRHSRVRTTCREPGERRMVESQPPEPQPAPSNQTCGNGHE